ncbi:hypothetical protein ACO22_00818 [Paracoccidioides brasiliensis]|uniref:Uncharacterized protein n=1 Tax=Paracoccidioides brasiliensis TaxID=121759 RepID=A0A1D2JNH5_PARBR|nr:hypothetical protein ACO22_00818 [Paracoccidioides brasiliensis]ODH50875.1 hypothetical protein GX48_03017 [Paracoccidioides brasiliensis]
MSNSPRGVACGQGRIPSDVQEAVCFARKHKLRPIAYKALSKKDVVTVAALMFADQDDKAAVQRLQGLLVTAVEKSDKVNNLHLHHRLTKSQWSHKRASQYPKEKPTRPASRLQLGPAISLRVGKLPKSAGKNDSAPNPAWRKTLTHITFSSSWNSSTSFDEQKEIYERITKVQVPLLKALEPGQMGAYMNEADSHEVDFQKSFL